MSNNGSSVPQYEHLTVSGTNDMSQITTRLPNSLAKELQATAVRLNSSRSQIVRQAIELYLDEIEDLEMAAKRIHDPNDQTLDWDRVRRELRDTD